ncbi:MAG: YihY/virulence factor BrkB family protein [Nocardioidaceae bacterium]
MTSRQGVALWPRVRQATWRVVAATIGACFRYRVTGLAAEAAFFAILSLPPLIFALAGSIGFFVDRFEVAQVETFRDATLGLAGRVLTDDSVESVIRPTMNDVLEGGRFDVISIGFVLALWSGSRALNVFVDTITILYGLAGRRGIVATRVLSFSLYVVGLVIGVIVLPLVLAGPGLFAGLLPDQVQFLSEIYWPIVIVLSVAFLATLYHLSVPVRTSWRYDVPGAALALGMWILGSYLLRWTLQNVVGGTSIYGPLAAPIAVLLWLYLTSLAVLVGAALNAAFDRVWPESETSKARLELVRRLRRAAKLERVRGVDTVDESSETVEMTKVTDDKSRADRWSGT